MVSKAKSFGLDTDELKSVLTSARMTPEQLAVIDAKVDFSNWASKQYEETGVGPDMPLQWRGHEGLTYREFLHLAWTRQIGPQSEALIQRLYERQALGQIATPTHAPADASAAAGEAAAGRCTPPDNMGGTNQSQPYVQLVMTESGEVKQVPLRRGWGGDSAFLDWVNFTVHQDTCVALAEFNVLDEDDHILVMSGELEKIFGFVVKRKRGKGANYYKFAYDLGDDTGAMVCIGGQRGTILVSMSGKSLAMAKPGWEQRLHDWLSSVAVQPRITRVDLAHDVLQGDYYDVDQAFLDYVGGNFSLTNRRPSCEMRGNWLYPDGDGRTLYVGKRKNGKFVRVYEKGRQLGDANSSWVRIEVEFKSVDRVIPFDVLLQSGQYLGGACPAFSFISERQDRINTIRAESQVTYQKAIENVKRQFGRYIWVIAQIEGDAQKAIDLLSVEEVPKNLEVGDWRHQTSESYFDRVSIPLPAELIIENAFR